MGESPNIHPLKPSTPTLLQGASGELSSASHAGTSDVGQENLAPEPSQLGAMGALAGQSCSAPGPPAAADLGELVRDSAAHTPEVFRAPVTRPILALAPTRTPRARALTLMIEQSPDPGEENSHSRSENTPPALQTDTRAPRASSSPGSG